MLVTYVAKEFDKIMKPFKDVFACDSITMNLTNNCNLNCIYCFEHNKQSEMMSEEDAIKIVDESYRYINPKEHGSYFMINFFGGEPFLNWKTMKAVIDHCNIERYRVAYGVTTNLTILTDEIIQYVDDNELHLLVSADGLKAVHDKNRSNSFDTVIRNLQRLIDAELQILVEIRMTILPEDIEYALDGIKMFMNMGFDNICPIPVTDVDWSDEDCKKLERFYEDLMQYYVELLNTKGTRNFAIKNTDEILLNVLEPEVHTPYMCPIGRNTWAAFDVNGDVYPCHQLPTSKPEYKIPQRIGNIWTGIDETKIITERKPAAYSKPECENCIGKAVCASGCPEENLRKTGDESVPFDGYCKTQIAMVKAVKKYQTQILNAKNIRNRTLNVLKENLKIKQYIDEKIINPEHMTKLEFSAKLIHVREMVDILDKNILPSFYEYFTNRIIEASAKYFDANDIHTLYLGKVDDINGR